MNADDRLELFFSQSLDGFFFMMLDEPIRWDDSIDKDRALDYVFAHQRVTKVKEPVRFSARCCSRRAVPLTRKRSIAKI
jgi:hypothetical protein